MKTLSPSPAPSSISGSAVSNTPTPAPIAPIAPNMGVPNSAVSSPTQLPPGTTTVPPPRASPDPANPPANRKNLETPLRIYEYVGLNRNSHQNQVKKRSYPLFSLAFLSSFSILRLPASLSHPTFPCYAATHDIEACSLPSRGDKWQWSMAGHKVIGINADTPPTKLVCLLLCTTGEPLTPSPPRQHSNMQLAFRETSSGTCDSPDNGCDKLVTPFSIFDSASRLGPEDFDAGMCRRQADKQAISTPQCPIHAKKIRK